MLGMGRLGSRVGCRDRAGWRVSLCRGPRGSWVPGCQVAGCVGGWLRLRRGVGACVCSPHRFLGNAEVVRVGLWGLLQGGRCVSMGAWRGGVGGAWACASSCVGVVCHLLVRVCAVRAPRECSILDVVGLGKLGVGGGEE